MRELDELEEDKQGERVGQGERGLGLGYTRDILSRGMFSIFSDKDKGDTSETSLGIKEMDGMDGMDGFDGMEEEMDGFDGMEEGMDGIDDIVNYTEIERAGRDLDGMSIKDADMGVRLGISAGVDGDVEMDLD